MPEGEPESVSGPSQRLHEMKEYFLRHQRAPNDAHEHNRNPYFEGAVFRSRSGAIVQDNRRDDAAQAHGIGNGGGGVGGGGSKQGERMPWHEGTNVFPPSVSTPATERSAENPPAVGVVSAPSGDGGDSGGRVWEVGTNAAATAGGHGAGGGNDGGDVGVEFDPQADNKAVHPGPVAAGGSPNSWWRDVPEPVVSNFPWDLQLPNPAPPLALPHAPIDIRGLPESSNMVATGGTPQSAVPAAAGSLSLRGAQEHSPLCRCEVCRFGKAAGHPRHRANEQLQQQPNALDMMEAGGRGGIRAGSGAVLMDAAARGTYGGMRWGMNPPPSAAEVAWGLGSSNGSGGVTGYLASRKIDDLRRGGAPPCDTFVPAGPHAPAYNVVPANPGMLHGTNPLGGPERFAPHESKSFSVAEDGGGADGVDFGARHARAKRARLIKQEGVHLSSGGIGVSSGESSSGQRLDKGGGRGGVGGSDSRDATGGGRLQRGKKTPASSRRCRHESECFVFLCVEHTAYCLVYKVQMPYH